MEDYRPRLKFKGERIWILVFMLGFIFSAAMAQEKSGKNQDCVPFDHTHGIWNTILQEYTQDGWVDYARLKTAGQDTLNSYLHTLETVCTVHYVSWSREEQIAF